MGAVQSQPAEHQLLTHPKLKNTKITTLNGQLVLNSNLTCDQPTFNRWQHTLTKHKENSIDPTYLMLPISYSFEKNNYCTDNGQVNIYYRNYSHLLSDEIQRRSQIGDKFEEPELWYLIFSIISARKGFKDVLGDIRPQNIFLNQSKQIKISTVASWPNEYSSYKKAILEDECGYLAPQDLQYLQIGKKNNHDHLKSEEFALGLTILSSMMLISNVDLYNLKQYKFHQKKFQKRLTAFAKDKDYSQIIKSLVFCLLEIDQENRISFEDIYAMLNKHKNNVINREVICFKNLDIKLQDKIGVVRKIIDDSKRNDSKIHNFINYNSENSQNSYLDQHRKTTENLHSPHSQHISNQKPPNSPRPSVFTQKVYKPFDSITLENSNSKKTQLPQTNYQKQPSNGHSAPKMPNSRMNFVQSNVMEINHDIRAKNQQIQEQKSRQKVNSFLLSSKQRPKDFCQPLQETLKEEVSLENMSSFYQSNNDKSTQHLQQNINDQNQQAHDRSISLNLNQFNDEQKKAAQKIYKPQVILEPQVQQQVKQKSYEKNRYVVQTQVKYSAIKMLDSSMEQYRKSSNGIPGKSPILIDENPPLNQPDQIHEIPSSPSEGLSRTIIAKVSDNYPAAKGANSVVVYAENKHTQRKDTPFIFHTYIDKIIYGTYSDCWQQLMKIVNNPTDYSSILRPQKIYFQGEFIIVGPAKCIIRLNQEEGKMMFENATDSRCEGVLLAGVFKDQNRQCRIWFNSACRYKNYNLPGQEVIHQVLQRAKRNIQSRR